MSSSYFNPTIEQLAPLIGLPVADALAGLRALGAAEIRNGDGVLTMDFVEGRVTYETDENGNVSQIVVEGGVIVDANILKTDPNGKPIEKEPPSGVNPIQSFLNGLIGQPAATAQEALSNLGVSTIRVIGPNDVVTMDYVPGRGNIFVDDKNIVTRVQIEGVADTDNKIPPVIDSGTTSSSYFNPTIDQLEPLIGQPVETVIAGLQALGATDIRNGDGAVTMDFVEGRVTYKTDQAGSVSQIVVEGGVTVNADVIEPDPDRGEIVKVPPSGVNPIQSLLTGLIGLSGTDASSVLSGIGITNIRVIGPNDAVTQDYVPGRANVLVDAKGVVTRVQIEGVADTDSKPIPSSGI
jgi:hypothetical protein